MEELSVKKKYYETVSKTIIKNLAKRQIEGYYCSDKDDALNKTLEIMSEGSSIAWGGSMSLHEIGLMDDAT